MGLRKKLGRSKRIKPKRAWFYDEIYSFSWFIQLKGSQQSALDWYADSIKVERYAPKDSNEPNGHFSAYRPYKAGVIWFKDIKFLKSQLSHEAFHGVMYVFERLDMKGPTEESEEVFAYYLQWLVNKIRSNFP